MTDAEILAERARLLARPPPQPAAPGVEALVFTLSGERWALPTAAVHEIARFSDYAAVPGGPPALVGVTNLHGEILPVFDLRHLLGIAPRGLTDLSRMLVLGKGGPELAVLADEVRENTRLDDAALFAPPESFHGLARGVTKDAVILLDAGALLRDPRLLAEES